MEFFSSWTFIIVMALLLVVMTVGPLFVALVVIWMARNREAKRGQHEREEFLK